MLQNDMGDKIKNLINEEFDDPIGLSENGENENLIKEIQQIDERLFEYKKQVQSIVKKQVEKDKKMEILQAKNKYLEGILTDKQQKMYKNAFSERSEEATLNELSIKLKKLQEDQMFQ